MSAKLVVYPTWGTKKEKVSRLDKKRVKARKERNSLKLEKVL